MALRMKKWIMKRYERKAVILDEKKKSVVFKLFSPPLQVMKKKNES